MDKDNKNPLLAGLMNVLVPGSSHLYINRDWGKFIRAFIIGVLAFTVAYLTGSTVQDTRGVDLPQGLCMGGLLMAVVVVYFISGFKVARERNNEMNASAFYDSKRSASHAGGKISFTKTQKMRDESLVSDQEYDAENAKTASNTK
jgi:hypothetical protein